MHFSETIDKETIAQLPIKHYTETITVVEQSSQVQAAIETLKQCPIIGFDTETKPSFRKGEKNTVSLLQLATQDVCFLFRLHLLGPNQLLKELLENDEILKVGLSVHDDFRALNQWMTVRPSNFIELQRYVKFFGIQEMSLQKIYAIVLQYKISKRQQLSNWEAPVLTEPQKLYAATDAWACRDIYYALHESINLQ